MSCSTVLRRVSDSLLRISAGCALLIAVSIGIAPGADAQEDTLPSIEENKPSTPDQNFQPAEIGPHGLPVPSNRWEMSCKYRGFWRMLRCLTLDPVVAQPAVDGRPPVQLRSLCLFNPAVGTRQRFTIPFHCDPSSREVALQPPVKSQQAPPLAMLSWRTEVPRPHMIPVSRLRR